MTPPSGQARREDFVFGEAWMVALVVFLGAGLGGIARYVVSLWIQQGAGTAYPWGTLVVNVTGSLLLTTAYGSLVGTTASAEWRAFLGIGFCGGYTTFSTFSFESLRLLQGGQWLRAMSYVASSVFLSLLAAVLGFRIAALLLRRG
jgi:CrcB protein